MTGLLGIKYRYVAGVVALALGGAVYLEANNQKNEPEQVDPAESYCHVVTHHGYLSRAFIRETDTGTARYRFEPSGDMNHRIANYLNKGSEIVGSGVNVQQNRREGILHVTRDNCTLTDYQGDVRVYAVK